MSNINEEKDDGLGAGYFKNLKDLREENEQNAQMVKDWQEYDGLKQPEESLPKILDEQGLHDEAKARTQSQNEEQAKLEEVGLAQEQGSRRKFGEKIEQAKGHDAIEQARTETRHEQELEQKQDRERDI